MAEKTDSHSKINLRMEKLKEYLGILRSLKGVTALQLTQDVRLRAQAERFLHLAAEACIDISELIISDQRFRAPENGREAIEILGEEDILTPEFAQHFAPIASFRNILVHDYLEIDYAIIAEKINNSLDDFDTFAQQVSQFLQL